MSDTHSSTQTAPHTTSHNALPLDLRRNQFAFGGDSMFFNIGNYFMPITTVMTAFVSELTSNKTLIGAISLAWFVSYLLPQLVAARALQGRASTKSLSVLPALLTRPLILAFAAWLFFTQAQQPLLTVWLFIVAIVIFGASDGVTTIAWFDMMGRALSPKARAQTLTFAGLFAALGGIPAGLVVERILSAPQLTFPNNYALIFLIAFVFYEISLVSMVFIQERLVVPSVAATGIPSAENKPSFAAQMRAAVKSDAGFRRLLVVRLLTGVESMAAAFYVVYARERLGLPDSSIGVFTLAYLVGSLVGIVALGGLAQRHGPRRAIHAAVVAQCVAPLLALAVSLVHIPSLTYTVFIGVLFLNGSINRAMSVGYSSYAQDHAPADARPMYVGAVNTVAGISALLPVVGGLLIDGLARTGAGFGAYSVLFGLCALLAGWGAWLSVGLREGRS